MTSASPFDEVVKPDDNPERPIATSWDEYVQTVRAEWVEALSQDDERAVHDCIVRHPCLAPVLPSGPGDEWGHHGPWMDAIVTEPPLEGFHRRVPDLMWIERHSAAVTVVCVEIERPIKYWFNLDGTPTHDLTQALDQIEEWRSWFSDHPPKDFFDAYRIPKQWMDRVFQQRYVLLYGRQSEFDDAAGTRHGQEAAHLNRKRHRMMPPDVQGRTLDSVVPSDWDTDLVTIMRRDHQLTALSIPPTFTTGEHVRALANNVEGITDLLRSEAFTGTPERGAYLADRIDFWRTVKGSPYVQPGTE